MLLPRRPGAPERRPLPCRACGGTGAVDLPSSSFLSAQTRCAACGGAGSVGWGCPDVPLDVGDGPFVAGACARRFAGGRS